MTGVCSIFIRLRNVGLQDLTLVPILYAISQASYITQARAKKCQTIVVAPAGLQDIGKTKGQQ
jgi:hypothetical protein